MQVTDAQCQSLQNNIRPAIAIPKIICTLISTVCNSMRLDQRLVLRQVAVSQLKVLTSMSMTNLPEIKQ